MVVLFLVSALVGCPGQEHGGAGADPAGGQAEPCHHPRPADPGHGEEHPARAQPGDQGQQLHSRRPLQVKKPYFAYRLETV